ERAARRSHAKVLCDGFGGEIQDDGNGVPGASGGRRGACGSERISGGSRSARTGEVARLHTSTKRTQPGFSTNGNLLRRSFAQRPACHLYKPARRSRFLQ